MYCPDCELSIPSELWASHLRSNSHKSISFGKIYDGVEILRTAFKCRIASFKIPAINFTIDFQEFKEGIKDKVLRLIREQQMKHRAIKINFEVFGIYYSNVLNIIEVKSFNTVFLIVVSATDLDELYNYLFGIIIQKADEFAERESGWYMFD